MPRVSNVRPATGICASKLLHWSNGLYQFYKHTITFNYKYPFVFFRIWQWLGDATHEGRSLLWAEGPSNTSQFNLFVCYHSCAGIRFAPFVDGRLTVWPSTAGFPAPWVASLTQNPLPRKPTLFHGAFLFLYNRSYPGSKPSILVPSDLQWLLYLPPFLKLQSSTCCPQSVLMCFEWFSQSA